MFMLQGTKFLGVGIENGYLKLAWSIPGDSTQSMTEKQWNLTKPTPVQSKLVPRAGFLADGEWHTMILRMEKTNLSIAVDQNLVAAEEPGWMNSDHDELDLFIGKALNWSCHHIVPPSPSCFVVADRFLASIYQVIILKLGISKCPWDVGLRITLLNFCRGFR